MFSTYRADSAISRLGRGEITLADCPPEVAEVLALGEAAERDSGGAFAVRRGGVLDPSGVVKGWAARARRHAPRRPAGHRLLPLRRRRRHLPHRRPRRAALARRHRGPARPDPAGRGRPRAHRGRRHLRHRPARRPHPRRTHRSPAHRRRVGHRHRSVADRGRHRRHRRLRPRPGRRALAPQPRPAPRSWCTPTARRPSSRHPNRRADPSSTSVLVIVRSRAHCSRLHAGR